MAVKWREEDDNEQKDIGCGNGEMRKKTVGEIAKEIKHIIGKRQKES